MNFKSVVNEIGVSYRQHRHYRGVNIFECTVNAFKEPLTFNCTQYDSPDDHNLSMSSMNNMHSKHR